MTESRANVVSSFTVIKGAFIDETYRVFQEWDFSLSRRENLDQVRATNPIQATSQSWLRDVCKVLNRRFDPNDRDRSLVELAQAGCPRDIWSPILLWHMTRDEFLLRDFLTTWLFDQHRKGVFRLQTEDLYPYFESLKKHRDIEWSKDWSDDTRSRVASGLLKIAASFGLLRGGSSKEFASFHLAEQSFLYLVHAMAEGGGSATRIIESTEWHMYLMDSSDVERELLRLHQFRKLHYEVAGSLAQLDLPYESAADYAKELCA